MEVDFEKMVGKRILVNNPFTNSCDLIEYQVLEVSPAGKFVKLENVINGNQYWKEASDVYVIEILKEIRF